MKDPSSMQFLYHLAIKSQTEFCLGLSTNVLETVEISNVWLSRQQTGHLMFYAQSITKGSNQSETKCTPSTILIHCLSHISLFMIREAWNEIISTHPHLHFTVYDPRSLQWNPLIPSSFLCLWPEKLGMKSSQPIIILSVLLPVKNMEPIHAPHPPPPPPIIIIISVLLPVDDMEPLHPPHPSLSSSVCYCQIKTHKRLKRTLFNQD